MLALQPRAPLTKSRVISRSLLISVSLFALSFSPRRAPVYTGPAKSSSFTSRFLNLEATGKETFRFNASLFNAQARTVIYSLQAVAPPGWNTLFRVQGMQVTSFQADSGRAQEISIELTPPPSAKPGKYQIPVMAISDRQDTLSLHLEAVLKGNYVVELTTSNGLLSGEGTEGKIRSVDLVLRNPGTLPLDNINLNAQAPAQWSVAFEPAKIDRLEPGSSINVTAHITIPDKTIAGDYVAGLTASNANVTSSASYRLTVTTSWLTGWFGILIILIAIGSIYYLIKKYGRR